MAGPVFSICFAVLTLFTGTLADKYNRKMMIGVAAIMWSLTSVGTSLANTFWEVCTWRLLLGIFEAFTGPIAYSLLIDYFPPEKRTVANSFYSLGIYVGAALSNITVIIIEAVGWREAYGIVAIFGITVGVALLVFVKEPERGRFEIKKAEPLLMKSLV